MSISRTGACPIFVDYVTLNALIPRSAQPSPQFQQFTQFGITWIDIPSYQRGIVWDFEKFQELLESTSEFLGHATFSEFPIPRSGGAPNPPFSNISANATNYSILVDGLQRFSIGTALLNILHTRVFSSTPQHAAAAPHFIQLANRSTNFAVVYQSNDIELRQHPREIVRESYIGFFLELEKYVVSELSAGNAISLAEKILRLFLARQIAPDVFHGFRSASSVARTFIGLNTTRVQLDPVDELRSIIIERGTFHGWTPQEVEVVENRFSEVFFEDGRPLTSLRPFVAIVIRALEQQAAQMRIFPSWQNVLIKTEVDNFLNFVEQVYASNSNLFFNEISNVGDIPLAGILCHYYKIYLQSGNLPSFVTGGNAEDAELCIYLRAIYRVLLDGRIGRTRSNIEQALYSSDLIQVAEALSHSFLGISMATTVDGGWLRAALLECDKGRSKRVFNACLLPIHGTGLAFTPHNYGASAASFQIDHLIPETIINRNQPGGREGNLLPNFAPLPQPVNRGLGNSPCSQKLAAGGQYHTYIQGATNHHPYVTWLVASQGQYGQALDAQANLLPNSNPDVGGERINWLVNYLSTRL